MVFDLHNDLITAVECEEQRGKILDGYSVGGNKVVLSVWAGAREVTPEYLTALADAYVGGGVYLGLEDCAYIDERNLGVIARLPILYAGLTWNKTNSLGGGAYGEGGLSALGKKVVRAFQKTGIIIDTAHANTRTFYDILGMSAKPVINSHSMCYDVYPHRRNINLDQIKLILDSGGIVGLTLVRSFTGAETFSYRLVKHIDWFVQRFGADNLAIGTDYYGSADIPNSVAEYGHLAGYLKRNLGKIGYAETAVNNILYNNAERFVKQNYAMF